jgi:hypothetical protein
VTVLIDVGADFSRFPAGRTRTDGRFSGEAFREDCLVPALRKSSADVVIYLDSAVGYGSSFLEEAFGGLVRRGFSDRELLTRIKIETDDPLRKEMIRDFIQGEAARNRKIPA